MNEEALTIMLSLILGLTSIMLAASIAWLVVNVLKIRRAIGEAERAAKSSRQLAETAKRIVQEQQDREQ